MIGLEFQAEISAEMDQQLPTLILNASERSMSTLRFKPLHQCQFGIRWLFIQTSMTYYPEKPSTVCLQSVMIHVEFVLQN